MSYPIGPRVYCNGCDHWLTSDEFEFLNIEEDPQGRDLVTFICDYCGTESKSLVRG